MLSARPLSGVEPPGRTEVHRSRLRPNSTKMKQDQAVEGFRQQEQAARSRNRTQNPHDALVRISSANY